MNILMLNWRGPKHPHAGGAEQATLKHAVAWVQAGHSVTWFTSHEKGLSAEETIDGVKIVRQGTAFFGVKLKAFQYYRKNNNSIDLIVDQHHGIPFFTPLYTRKPKLLYIHEVAKEVWMINELRQPYKWIYGSIGRIGEPIVLQLYRSTQTMTVSESTKKALTDWKLPAENIHVIHNGVHATPRTTKKRKTKTIMHLGALSKDKGIEAALEVFAKLHGLNQSYEFWVVGKGDRTYVEHLKKHAQELGVADRITWWGFVSESKKTELLAKTHVVINPSHYEGWGLVNIEANMQRTPVVGFDVAGLRDSIQTGKTGILVPFGDTEKMADKTHTLLTDTTLYTTMSKNAYNWAKKFTWKKSTSESLDLIMSIQ